MVEAPTYSSMNALIQKIHSSLLNLVGVGIETLPAIILALIILLLTRYGAGLAQKMAAATGKRTLRSESLQLLLVQIAAIATWVVGILAASVVAFPDLELGDVVGLLGLGSVAIGFAFQDIFKNFLAGVLLLVREPFRLHDQIIVNEFEGTVEAINIRVTILRTYQGERVLIPNAVVFTSAVQVLTALPHRRTDLAVGVHYNTSLPEEIALLLQTLSSVDGVFEKPAPEIDVVSFGESCIDLMVRYWTPPQKKHVRRIQTTVMIAIKQAFDQAAISIPYPVRTLYLFDHQRLDDHLPSSLGKTPS